MLVKALGVSLFLLLACLNVALAQPQAGFNIVGLPGNNTPTPAINGGKFNICQGTVLTFQNTGSAGNRDSLCYKITNGTTSDDDCDLFALIGDVHITFNNASAATVTQNIRTTGGQKSTITVTFNVSNNYPSAIFTPPGAQCGSTTFNFSSTSNPGAGGSSITSYLWEFTGSSTATSNSGNPSIFFDQAIGNSTVSYPVTLVVTNSSGCSDSVQHSVSVNQIPDVNVASSNAAVKNYSNVPVFALCDNVTDIFNFYNASSTKSTNTNYQINWGNSSTPSFDSSAWNSQDNITYKIGYDTMTVTITGSDGCTNTVQYGVFLGQKPGGGISSPPGSSIICVGSSLSFPFAPIDSSNTEGTSYEIKIKENPEFDTVIYQKDVVANWPYQFTHVFNQSSCNTGDPSNTDPNAFFVHCLAGNACFTVDGGQGSIYVSGKPKLMITASADLCNNTAATLVNNADWSGVYPYCTKLAPDAQQVWQITSPPGGSYLISNNPGTLIPWASGDKALDVTFSGIGAYQVQLYVRSPDPDAAACVTGDTSNHTSLTVCVRNPPFAKFTLNKTSGCAPYTFIAFQAPDTTLAACGTDSVGWAVTPISVGACIGSADSVAIDTNTPQTAKLTFPQAGKYAIVLTVASQGGNCSSQFIDTVTVYAKPNISGWADSFNVCTGTSIQPSFTTTTCFNPTSNTYKWIFSGGNPDSSSTLTPPPVTYNTPSMPGGDTITLAVTNGCGVVKDTAVVRVISQPVIDSIHNKAICSGDSVGLKLSSPVVGVVYSWVGTVLSGSVTGVSSGGGQNIPDVLTSSTKSVVEYEIWDLLPGGTCISDTMKVRVTVLPGTPAYGGPNQFLCNKVTATTLHATPPPTGTGAWSIPTSPTVSIKNADSATTLVTGLLEDSSYQFVWTISGSGSQCADSTDTVIVSTRPIINIVDTPPSICDSTALTIYGQMPKGGDSTAYTYQWQQGSNIGTFANVIAGFSLDSLVLNSPVANTYYRRIITAGSCMDTSNVVQVNIITKAPTPSFTPSDTSACASPGNPMRVTFNNTTKTQNKFTFQWFVDSVLVSQLPNPGTLGFNTTASGTGDTVYTITLKASNVCLADSVKSSIIVKSRPGVLFTSNKVIGCSAGPVTFTNLSVMPIDSSNYTWHFGDGGEDATNSKIVTHIYHNGSATTYNVTLTASSKCGVDTSQPLAITIDSSNIGLYVDISSTDRFICTGDSVHFQNKSSGATSFIWNFGDSTSITTTNNAETIVHQYKNAGTYFVSICANNYCIADTCTHDIITVGAKPSASFTVAPDTLCAGEVVQFNNTSSPTGDPGIIFTWNFGDNSSPNHDLSPGHAYANGGTDTVLLIVGRQFTGLPPNNTCADTAQAIIAVDKPDGAFSYADTLCQGQTVTFTVKSNTATHYKFLFGDGSYVDTNVNVVTHAYNLPGAYLPSVMLAGFSGKCFNTVVGADSIRFDSVQAAFKFDSIPVCNSTTLQFADSSFSYFGIQAYTWSINGQVYNVKTPSQVFTQSGTYNIRLQVKGVTGCNAVTQSQVYVYVHQSPAGNISVNSDTCTSDSVYFSANVFTNEPPLEYLWDFGNGDKQNGQSVSTVFAPAGVYNVQLTAVSGFGCSDTIIRPVAINATPDLSIAPRDSLGLCNGESVQLSVSGTGVVNWSWSPVNGLSCTNCSNPKANPTVNTLYTVSGTNSAGCTGTAQVVVSLAQPVHVSVSPANISVCLPVSLQPIQLFATGAYSYTWSPSTWLNNNAVFNPVVTVPDSAMQTGGSIVYTATGYDQYHCFTDTASVILSIGLTPTIDLGIGDTGIAGRTVILKPLSEVNGPFQPFNWVVNGSGSIGCLNGSCDSVQLTINGSVTFIATAVNSFGCSITDSIHYDAFCNQGEQVYIPNAFSPDRDGINDVFMVQGRGIIVETFKVFNRWGQVVYDGGSNFAPNAPAHGWNGTLNGKPVTEDVYVYIAKLRCTASNISYFAKGNVTLIRVK